MAEKTTDKNNLDFIIPGSDDKKSSGKIKSKNLTIVEDELAAHMVDGPTPDLIEYESNKGYQQIARKVVEISKEYLTTQTAKKTGLRKLFSIFFICILSIQLLFLFVLIILNSCHTIPFQVSEYILTTYIASVFVETLSAIGVMLSFCFTSKEESKIVGILTTVIQNYQKYNSNRVSGK